MTIKIPVSADFDASQAEQRLREFEQRLNALGKQVAQANSVKYEPISSATLEDLKRVSAQFENLKRISGDLNRRIKNTGQSGAGFTDLDWGRMYPDNGSRARQMRKAFEYVTGTAFHVPPTPPQPSGNRPHGGPPAPQQGGGRHQPGIMQQTMQAGLSSAGPGGRVAAGALNTGMQSGFGAGLMGLFGGILALGVGKMVGGVMEKLDQAENNMVSYDRMKRMIGDVNVSFDALRTVVEGAAKNIHVTFDEAGKLGSQFVKLGNVTAEQHKAIGQEIETAGGLSRSFGLDPSVGVQFMGQMRGMRQTRDENDSRRFALLVGETIAKSNAFAKADEVMGAIADYTTQQTRASLGANVEGYAGMFSALTGSGIAGLDPAGAAGLLAKINASLSAGGAFGESSQFFTSMIGNRMGLDPFQMRMLREGGAMATINQTFGAGSAAARIGMGGPTGAGGNETLLEATLKELKAQYGNSPGLMASAAANHLGISMSQAAALLTLQPNQMGEMRAYLGPDFDLTQLNSAGISSISQAVFGSAQDREGIANSLRLREGAGALSDEERRRLDQVMAGGDVEEQKRLLAKLVATRDQERTQGKDIHDSKVAIENIKTDLASKLIPLTQEMRNGIMYLAGGGSKSPREIQQEVLRLEHADRAKLAANRRDTEIQRINAEYAPALEAQNRRIVDARMSELGGGTPQEQWQRRQESRRIQDEANAEIQRIQAERDRRIQEERSRFNQELRAGQEQYEAQTRRLDEQMNIQLNGPSGTGGATTAIPPMIAAPETAAAPATPAAPQTPSELVDSIVLNGRMTRGYRNNNPGNLESTVPWEGMIGDDGRFARFASPAHGYRALGRNLMTYGSRHGINTIRGIVERYAPRADGNNTDSYIRSLSRELGVGADETLNMRDQETLFRLIRGISQHENGYIRHDESVMRQGVDSAVNGTPLPIPPSASINGNQRFILDAAPIEIIHRNERGDRTGEVQIVNPTIRSATPFGTGRIA